MPGDERSVQAQRVVDAEVGELRSNPRLVHRAIAEVAAGQRDVRLERRLHELRVRHSPSEPGEHADVSPLDEAEPAGSPGDLRELPRQEVAPLLPVELRRLREEKRLAGEVDAVPENVGRDADVGGTGDEALDLLAP